MEEKVDVFDSPGTSNDRLILRQSAKIGRSPLGECTSKGV
jgi:hypothetical protein